MKHASTKQKLASHGFTLVELLVTMTVSIVVGGIVVTILANSFKATTRSQSLEAIRQNGNYAITEMERMLRYVQTFDGVSNTANDLSSFHSDSSTCNGTTAYRFVKYTSFDSPPNNQAILDCNASGNIAVENLSFTPQRKLLDTTSASGATVVPNSCSFKCGLNTSGVPVLTIDFSLTPNNGTCPATTNACNFHTSVTFRNYR